MKYSKQDITRFKKINIILGVFGLLVMIFGNLTIGGGLFMIALVAYLAPFQEE